MSQNIVKSGFFKSFLFSENMSFILKIHILKKNTENNIESEFSATDLNYLSNSKRKYSHLRHAVANSMF
jgi:hypothetical protein